MKVLQPRLKDLLSTISFNAIKKIKNGFLIASFFMIASCGGENPDPSPGANIQHLPLKVLKLLPEGEIRGKLEVYDAEDILIEEVPLEVNLSTGQVSSPLFQLTKGQTYTFINTFYFQNPSVPEIAFAAVIKEENIVEDSEEIVWKADEVMTCPGHLPVDLQNNISLPHLAPLDEDQDNFCNFVEIVKGSNPRDANNLPAPPRLEGEIENIEHVDLIKFTLNAKDPMGVASIRPIAPNRGCGYREFAVTEAVPGDDREKILSATFNTHAYNGESPVELQIEVKDILGLTNTYTYSAKFIRTQFNDPNDPNYISGPEIIVLTPEANSTISGNVNFEAQACDKNGIKQLQFADYEAQDESMEAELFSALLNTEGLANGLIDISFEAINAKDEIRVLKHPVIVDNFAQIQIIEPTGGSTVGDAFTITALLNKNDVADTVLAFRVKEVQDPQGYLTPLLLNSLDANNADTVFQANVQDIDPNTTDREVTVTVEALIQSPNSDVPFQKTERAFTFRINKDPDITMSLANSLDPTYRDCLAGGYADLNILVKNLKPLAQESIEYYTSVDANIFNLIETFNAQGAESYAFSQEVICSSTPYHLVKAGRPSSVDPNIIYETTQQLALNLVNLENFVDIVDSPLNSPTWTLSNTSKPPFWALEGDINEGLNTYALTNVGQTEGSNSIELIGLQPRSLYQLDLSLTNNMGAPITTRESLNFLTRDDDLLLWWPLNSYTAPGYNENLPLQARDFSGNNHHATLENNPIWSNQAGVRGLKFEGAGTAFLPSTGVHGVFENIGQGEMENIGYTMETMIYVNQHTNNAKFIVSQNNEIAIGIRKNGDDYYFNVTLGIKEGELENTCVAANHKGFAENPPTWEVIWGIGGPGVNNIDEAPDPKIDIAKWYHLAVTISTGDMTDDKKYQVKFYVNGELEEVRNYNTEVIDAGPWQNNCDFYLTLNGVDYIDNNIIHQREGGNFKGIIGEVAIYNHSLSEEQIADNCVNLGVCLE